MSVTADLKVPMKLWTARRCKRVIGSMASVLAAAVLGYLLWKIIQWALLDAVFSSDGPAACHQAGTGACWSVIAARWRLILFGLYPYEEQWRSAIACVLIVAVGILSCTPAFWNGLRLCSLWIAGLGLFYLLMRGGVFGLVPVFEQNWGGLSLTLFIFAMVSFIGLPLSIVFALLRRSELPWISRTMGIIIDTVRSLPLVSILFTAAVVLPFLMPGWLITDKLYRVIFGFAVFFACYQAEVLRGGMQSLSAGQEEAAKALGLRYRHRISRIVLPQAFYNALPPTINQFVITFKETSLVTIIGFFEVLASGHAAFGTAEWNFADVEVYIFVAVIYFAFVFSLSRYGAFLERRLKRASR